MRERYFRYVAYFLLFVCAMVLTDLASLTYLTFFPSHSSLSAIASNKLGDTTLADTKKSTSSSPAMLRLDSRLPVQTYRADQSADNVNTTFGSRFDFVVNSGADQVNSGTDGLYHDNAASYIVGIAPSGKHKTWIFHMGTLDNTQGDTYLLNEEWTQGLDMTRWVGNTGAGASMQVTLDIIDAFSGEPKCIEVYQCSEGVRDDTVPVLLIGVTLHNIGSQPQTGKFLFGSNRALPSSNACVEDTTPGGTFVNLLSYSQAADATGGTLFLAGAQNQWQCNTSVADRAGLAWSYTVNPSQSETSYMVIGGWNPQQNLFINTRLPSGCQQEALYTTQEWSSEAQVVGFAIDNLSTGDNLLGRAQSMENTLINNNILTRQQRWIIADSLHSYKAETWLVGRQSCAGGGYDAAVYEGSYRYLTTVDVMYDYGYFEINLVPWFFRSAMLTVLAGAQTDSYGVYFQHDQGGDVNSQGQCTDTGSGTPTIRASCYGVNHPAMPTEEDSNVALLTAYYLFVTGDTGLLTDNNNANMKLIDGGMQHNQKVANSATGIADQDTNTTFDFSNDCLHDIQPNAENLYYEGLKEATAYRATAYLDSLVAGDNNGVQWQNNAAQIENAIVQEDSRNGFIPIAENTDEYSNCGGRTVVTGDGLLYSHLIGLDSTMNQSLLQDLASQYPSDLQANMISTPQMISLESTTVSGSERYEWFSKVMQSSIVADLIYTNHGCTSCHRVDVVSAVYKTDVKLPMNYGDGLIADGSDWSGYFYPRGMISWTFLNAQY